jgi:hypothetical protein
VVQVGRLTLRETYASADKVNASTGVRTIELTGQESYPPLTRADWQLRREDILGLLGRLVPVTFENKTEHNGYYVVEDSGAEIEDWSMLTDPAVGRTAGKFDWTLRLSFLGQPNAVDLESRVTAVARKNDYAQSGTRWHAPAGSSYAYTTGTTPPSTSVARSSEDGVVTVYTGVPASVSPRWGAALASYPIGRVRVLTGTAPTGTERTGVNLTLAASGAWTLSNGLTRVIAATPGTLRVDHYISGAWTAGKVWNVSRGGSGSANALGPADGVTVLRNDYEAATIRLVTTFAAGRSILDLTLRRGSRFVEGYLQTDASTTLGVSLLNAEAGTAPASGGYIAATVNDAHGDRAAAGSARTFVANTAATGFYKASVVALDFWLGLVVAGGSAVAGDAAVDLQAQYVGAMAERVMGVRR